MTSINRRTFLKRSGSLAAVAPFLSMRSLAAGDLRVGLQLFSIRDFMDKDPVKSLEKVATLGYKDLETYGLNPEANEYYGLKAKELKSIIDDLGMTTSSGHYGLANYLEKSEDSMKKYVDQCIQGAKDLDQAYITWPWLPPESRTLETYKALPELLSKIGEQVSQAGLGFAYHNHGFDLADLGNGVTGYELIRKEADPALVKLQLDMYWAVHAGYDPAEIIAQEPKRYVMWHIKDMDKITRDYSEMGNGSIDYVDILSKASQEGLEYYFIEQGGNYAVNSMQSAETSMKYFKKRLRKYM